MGIKMRIEKINENQIRCTLTKQDLAERQIKLSELAYGTEKVKELFRDMMEQAAYECGFEAEDMPLMIEAIPLSTEAIIVIVTKVECPEELDTRFSRFSEPNEEYLDEEFAFPSGRDLEPEGADDVLGLFRKIQEERDRLLEKQKAESFVPLKDLKTKEESVKIPEDITKLFVFQDLDNIIRAAHVLNGYYEGKNDLYKNETAHKYYLLVRKSSETPEGFNKVCNILSEYAMQQTHTAGVEAFLKEHYHVLLAENALQILTTL